MVQTFVIRGWLDNYEWGDEPPDPDDVWAEGDRVRLKDFTAEGTVQSTQSQPFLGGYLPYVQVLWDGKKLPVPIDPSLLVRLSRTLPEELTWQAAESFSDCKEMLSVSVTQENVMPKTITPSLELETVPKFKPGDTVYVKRGNKRIKRTVGERVGTGKNSGKILTLGGRSGSEEYWELPAKLELCSLTIETALLDFNELLSALDYQSFTSIVTLEVHFHSRYGEQQIITVLEQLEQQGKVEKRLCPDGKTYSWRKLSSGLEEEMLVKIHEALPDADWIGDWDLVKLLEYEFSLLKIQQALRQLGSEGKAIKQQLNGGVVWQKNSQSSIFVQELDWAIQQQASSSENNSTLLDSAKSMNPVETSSPSDIPTFALTETSEIEKRLQALEQKSYQHRSPVSLSPLLENGTVQTMSETSSPTSSTSLTTSDQTTSPSRTFLDSSTAPTDLGEPSADFLDGFSGNFLSGGTMFNGKLSEAPTLALPSLGTDLFWLRSPQALSSTSETSRPPGQSKLEVQLKQLGLIGNNQVINPEFLAKGLYNLPANWASLSELRAATEIFATSAKPMETALTQESLTQPLTTSDESSKQELQEHLSDVETDRDSGRFKQKPTVSLTHPNEQEAFIQNDPSSFEWQGPGEYWIYPESVDITLGTQSRVTTDDGTVKYYATQMEDDLWEWQASIVGLVWDGDQLLPYDGHHRLKAARVAGKMILARIQEGDLHKAIALSCGSNKKPSFRRTKDDNQKTIQMIEDLRASNGDEWLLNIINAELPVDKHFKEVSLRAIEVYTGIPFKTISRIRNRKDADVEKIPRISFVPTDEEMDLIQSIMDSEGFEKPSEVFKWLLKEHTK